MSFQKIKSSTSRCFDISTAALHIIAMLFMLMDHLWATLLPAQEWLTCVGRIAFPIFAFMSVEGYFHTHNFKKYLLRMLVFAVISEIPFDLMYGGTWFYPVHQNVIWTFVLGLLGIHIMETVRKKKKTPVFVLTAILVTIAGGLLGTLTMVDYYGIGVLTVFIFYFFRGRKWWCLLGQIAALYWVNVELLGGLMYPVRLFGMEFELCQQGLALLALVPIWLYRGRQGYHSKPFLFPLKILSINICQIFRLYLKNIRNTAQCVPHRMDIYIHFHGSNSLVPVKKPYRPSEISHISIKNGWIILDWKYRQQRMNWNRY